MLTVGSLFAGIGGFDLGLESAGMRVLWQVEVDEMCRRILRKHWPDVQQYADIHNVDFTQVAPVDVLCGGFPCQPFSSAGKRKGLSDERWLWPEFLRAIDAIRPAWVIVENAKDLVHSPAFTWILWSLSAIGYDAEWTVFRASALHAPHERPRLWLIGYPNKESQPGHPVHDQDLAILPPVCGTLRQWPDRPAGMGVDDGVSDIVDRVPRLRRLGNAVVPRVAEAIGRWILLRVNGARCGGCGGPVQWNTEADVVCQDCGGISALVDASDGPWVAAWHDFDQKEHND